MPGRRTRAWVRSKVAWRLLLLFLLCAVVPTTVVAVAGYQQLASTLRADADRTLQRAGQSLSDELLARLGALEAEIDRLDARRTVQTGPWPRALLNDLAQSFSQVTYRGNRELHILLGSPVEFPDLDEEARAQLDAGHTLITALHGEEGHSLLMARRGASGLWTARAPIERVIPSWEEAARAGSTDFCALDGRGRLIDCSSRAFASSDPTALAPGNTVAARSYPLRGGDEDYLASRWTLPFAPAFYDPHGVAAWAIVVVIPQSEIFGPLITFRSTFTLLATLTIAFATLLSLTQIRRQLGPLEQLREGTRHLAAGDFDFALAIRSGDDFEELAHSFNQMTETLRTQFDSLQRMVEIDRSILSEITATRVLETMVERVGELFPARVAIALVSDGDSVLSTTHTHVGGMTREHHGELRGADLESWFPGAEPRCLDEQGDGEGPVLYDAILASHGHLVWTAIPLRFHADLVRCSCWEARPHRAPTTCSSRGSSRRNARWHSPTRAPSNATACSPTTTR